jgi:hypothetical protein
MSDIVERLRHWRIYKLANRNAMFDEAAFEIERLRIRLRLTDAEREAVEAAIAWMAPVGNYDFRLRTTLQSMLARIQ